MFRRIPRPVNNNPRRIGKLSNNANNPSGTVNKFKPGIKNVNNPLRINGSNNNPGNSNAKFNSKKNGSPPSNALRRPTMNPAIAAGIALTTRSSKNLSGNANNPNNP